jgi:ribonucleoside-diphosphate reductase alpha chain
MSNAVAHHPRVTQGATMALASEQAGIGLRRQFTTEGANPYDDVVWERRDARITNYRDGSVAFEQLGV